MNYKEASAIIAAGESISCECKSSMAELEKLGHSLCGMLNVKGGFGLIGVNDKGDPIGIEVTDSTKKKITSFIEHFDPWPNLAVEYIKIPEKTKKIVIFECKINGDEGPFAYRGRAYLKTESGVKLMPTDQYKELLLKNAGASKAWESRTALDVTLDDLDQRAITKTLNLGIKNGRIPEEEYTENVSRLLTNFDLIHDNELSNAAVVLFSKKMPATYSQCFIRMGRFVDETFDEVIDSLQMRGNAFEILEAAQDFVKKHLPISSRFDPNKFERIDEIALPLVAVREAIVNSICHRDYSKPSGDISLCIFNDYLVIHNVGHLYGGLTIDLLNKTHPSRRRNERIAQVFYARGLIDRWGGGTRRIFRLCEEAELPTPVFSEKDDGFQVKFTFKESIGVSATQQTKDMSAIKLTERHKEIITILAQGEGLALSKIHEQLKKPPALDTIGDDLEYLRSVGLIANVGKGRGSKWHLV